MLGVTKVDTAIARWDFSSTVEDIPGGDPDLRVNGQMVDFESIVPTSSIDFTYAGAITPGQPWTTQFYSLGDIVFGNGLDITTLQTGVVL